MEVDAAVRENTLAVLDTLRDLGAEVDEVELGWDESIITAARSHWAHGWAATLDELLDEHRDDLCDYTVWFIDTARHSTRREHLTSIETAVRMYDRFGPLMDEYDLFVCPTLMTSGIPNDSTWPENEIEINGRILQVSEEYWSATFPFNMLSRCPVMSLPSGLAANGVPTAVQFVARSYDDQRAFSAALAFEQAFERPAYRLDQRLSAGD